MRLFTVQQAEELIPHLEKELSTLQPRFARLMKVIDAIADEYKAEITDPLVRDACLADKSSSELLNSVEDSLQQLAQLGVECKGIEEGLIDFPCLLEDRVVYLCWRQGEDRIEHWHELDDGYASRKPLLEAMAEGRRMSPLVN